MLTRDFAKQTAAEGGRQEKADAYNVLGHHTRSLPLVLSLSLSLSPPCMLAHRLPLKKSVLGSIFLVQAFPAIRQTLARLRFSFTLNSGFR